VTQRTIRVRTSDGVRLSGIAAPAAATPAPVTFVVAHGFTHSVGRPPFTRLVGWLRASGEVRAVDFRGHGRSGGGSSVGGDPELLDVDAVVASARADGAGAVVTLGLSMGGGAVLRQAVLGEHRPDAVVSVSAVSRWYADVWAVPGMGHGKSSTTVPLVERIGRWAIGAVAGLGPRGSASIGR
jgi:alpha-beta hydrolase superfamily lysophospholipase